MKDAGRQLAAQLIEDRLTPLFAHLVLFALLSLLLLHSVPHALLLWWGGSIFAVSVIRLGLWEWLRRRTAARTRVATVVRWTMLGLGLVWGLGTVAALQYMPLPDVGIVLLGLTGLLAGGLATLVADRWVFPIYAIAMFLPVALAFVRREAAPYNDVGLALIIMYLGFTYRLHAREHAALLQRLNAEAILRERERQLANAQSIAHVGSWEWDIATNVVTWSDELRRMYGVGPHDPTGYAQFLERAHPDDRARLEAMVAHALASRQAVDYEWRCIRPDGEMRHILGRNIVVTNSAGEALRMAGTSLDITDRKRAEQEIKMLRGILPICASCKRIRGDAGRWEAIEGYVRDHSNAEFSHGLCPDCAARDWGAGTL